MSENSPASFFAFVALVIVLALFAGLSAHFGHLHRDKIFEEVFTAAVEVFMEACVAGIVLWWYQKRKARRAEKDALVRQLSDIRAQVLAASFLMHSHRSGSTWVKQLQLLIAASGRVEEVKHSIEILEGSKRSKSAVRHLNKVLGYLKELRSEYRDQHERVDKDQTRFEDEKKRGTSNLEAHWTEMLGYLKKTNDLVLQDESSALLSELGLAADYIRK